MDIIFQGLLLGLSLSLLLGPVVFMFIDATMQDGFKGGFLVGLGVWTSDFIYITIAVLGFSLLVNVFEHPMFQLGIGCIGGSVLILIGIQTFINGKKLQRLGRPLETKSPWKLWLKGFLVNLFNPFCALIWFGSISTVMSRGVSKGALISFVVSVLGTLIFTDILKILLSDKLIQFLSSGKQLVLKKASGILIAILGVLLVIRVLAL